MIQRSTYGSAISRLQELCVQSRKAMPIYDFCGEEWDSTQNPNAKLFKYTVTALDLTAEGKSRSKQDAKQQAALALIVKTIAVPDGMEGTLLGSSGMGSGDKVMELGMLCKQLCLPDATFQYFGPVGKPNVQRYTCECKVDQWTAVGVYPTKKGAKQVACQEMIKTLQPEQPEQEDKKTEE